MVTVVAVVAVNDVVDVDVVDVVDVDVVDVVDVDVVDVVDVVGIVKVDVVDAGIDVVTCNIYKISYYQNSEIFKYLLFE